MCHHVLQIFRPGFNVVRRIDFTTQCASCCFVHSQEQYLVMAFDFQEAVVELRPIMARIPFIISLALNLIALINIQVKLSTFWVLQVTFPVTVILPLLRHFAFQQFKAA